MFGEDICVIPCTTSEAMVRLNTMAPEPVIDAYYYEYTAILRFIINAVLDIRVVKGIKKERGTPFIMFLFPFFIPISGYRF